MAVCASPMLGIKEPSQRGQLSPQPAPDCVAWTTSPLTITPMVNVSTPQEKPWNQRRRSAPRAVTIASVAIVGG